MHNTSERGRRLGLIQIHIAVLLAGGAGLFAKLVPVDSTTLTAGRTVFGSIALLLFALLTRTSLRLRGLKDLAFLALCGAILAAHWFTFFHAIQVSTVAVGLLAFSAFPLFTTLLEPLVFRERLRPRDIVTALIVMVGLILVVPGFDVADRMTQGLLWGLLSALTYAVLSLLIRAGSASYPAPVISFYQQAFAALCTLPFALAGGVHVTGESLLWLALLGVVFTALGQGLVVASLHHLRAQTTSIIFALEPVYGIALAWLLAGEIPGTRTLLGGGLICGAVLWASLAGGKRNRKPDEAPPVVSS